MLVNNSTYLQKQLNEYNQSRQVADKSLICHAPFNNLYFNIHGQVAPCWLTLANADNIKDKTIREIWNGNRLNAIRQAIQKNNLDYACTTCQKNISCGNYVSTLAKLYDLPYTLTDYPAEMEFELSNICNLECVMCKGDLSSAIRKNREHLPAIESPYTNSFAEQLREFLPHLKEAKFLGGEPFLVPVYYKIWDAIIDINPNIKITITTNGTVWNARVKQILESLHCNIIISIDAFSKETYENIRIGSRFEKVIEHFEHFKTYTTQKNTYMGVSINPLRKNWRELPDFVNFCNQKNVSLWFNTVLYPYREALWTLPASELEKIYTELSSVQNNTKPTDCAPGVYENNISNYKNLVEVQIKTWWQEAMSREKQKKSDLATLTHNQLFEKLKAGVVNYLRSDAYIPMAAKLNQINRLEKKLTETDLTNEKLHSLYTLPEETLIDLFETEL